MKRLLFLMLGMAMASLIFTFSAMSAAVDDEKALYELAKKEGEVRFAGVFREDPIKAIGDLFSKKYPGIKITYTRKSSAPMIKQVELERMSGINSFDIINLSDNNSFLQWKRDKFLLQFKPSNLKATDAKGHDPDGFIVAVGINPEVGCYNSRLITDANAPKSLKDLIDPKWKGMMSDSPPQRGNSSYFRWRTAVDLYGWDYLKNLAKNEVMWNDDHSTVTRLAISGERPLAPCVPFSAYYEEFVKGQPLKIIITSEGVPPMNPSAAILKTAKNPNAAKLLENFLLTPDVQLLMATSFGYYPVRKDVTSLPASIPKLSGMKLLYVDPEIADKEREKWFKDFDRIFRAN
jgi:iron(III) transport system substrate-binding protein